MTRASALAERTVLGQFVDAVLAFSDDPRPANLERYLAASRAVEEARAAARPKRRDRRQRKENHR